MRRSLRTAGAVTAVVLLVQPLATTARAASPPPHPHDGGVLAWGAHEAVGGGAPYSPRGTPVDIPPLVPGTHVVAVSGGGSHSLALRSDGDVFAWGRNYSGQVGNGQITPTALGVFTQTDVPHPVAVVGLGPAGVVAVAAGNSHSLALRSDGAVLAWGADEAGQLGDGGANVEQATPVVVSGLGAGSGAVAVAAGGDHSLALKADGSVLAWGHGCCGQLGDGTMFADRSTPVAVAGLGPGSGVVAIDAGESHSLALRADGSVVAWGAGYVGQLGNGPDRLSQSAPVPVGGLGPGSGVVEVSAGGGHNLALRADGSVLSWGNASYGELGNDFAVSADGPVAVKRLGPGSGVVAIAAGRSHSLALQADGGLLAWGWDAQGQLGEVGDSPGKHRASPVPVTGLGARSGAIAIDAGNYHSLAVHTGAQGYSVGAGDGGVFSFGSAGFFGSPGGRPLNRPVVGIDHTATARGYWLVAADGGIFAYGDAAFFGSTGGLRLSKPIVGMERTPSGNGYWLVAADGGVFAFGDAAFFGSTGGIPLNQPVVAMERTPAGDGYWLVAADGGIFAFGAATFFGSTVGKALNGPVVGMSRARSGSGYHLAAADGGVFVFGDAVFRGSAVNAASAPVVGIMPTPNDAGYWLCARDGAVYPFGNARGLSGVSTTPLGQPLVGCDASLNLSG